MFNHYIPIERLMTEAQSVMSSTVNPLARCDATKSQASTEHVWKLTDPMATPYHRTVAVLVFYSQLVRRRVMSGNTSILNHNEMAEIMMEWGTLIPFTSPVKFHQCICGHDVAFPIYLTNSVNNNIVKIGLDCMMKFLPHMQEVARLTLINLTSVNQFKMCGSCFCFKIPPTEQWKTLCADCYSSNRRIVSLAYKIAFFYKDCVKCGNLSVPGNRSVPVCEDCRTTETLHPTETSQLEYVDTPQVNQLVVGNDGPQMKQCTVCCQLNIPPEESWKSMCKGCYMAKRGGNCGGNSNTSYGDKVACQKCGMKKIAADKAHIFKLCFTCHQTR